MLSWVFSLYMSIIFPDGLFVLPVTLAYPPVCASKNVISHFPFLRFFPLSTLFYTVTFAEETAFFSHYSHTNGDEEESSSAWCFVQELSHAVAKCWRWIITDMTFSQGKKIKPKSLVFNNECKGELLVVVNLDFRFFTQSLCKARSLSPAQCDFSHTVPQHQGGATCPLGHQVQTSRMWCSNMNALSLL